jgi:O-methyltransferase
MHDSSTTVSHPTPVPANPARATTAVPDIGGPAARSIELKPAEERYLELLKRTLTASMYPESAWRIIEAERGADRQARVGIGCRIRDVARRHVVRWLDAHGLSLVRRRPYDPARREEGVDQPMFGYSMAGHRRMENVRSCVEDVIARGIPGDFLEAGAWRGGMTIWMRALLQQYGVNDRTVWVADSFDGLPESRGSHDGPDLSHVEHLKVSLRAVKANFEQFGLLDEQVKFIPGWFKDTLPIAPVDRLAVLRLDGDMYTSTMETLVPLYDKVSPGGWIIVDDFFAWDGCRAAVRDFLRVRGLDPHIRRIDWTGACWQKG